MLPYTSTTFEKTPWAVIATKDHIRIFCDDLLIAVIQDPRVSAVYTASTTSNPDDQ